MKGFNILTIDNTYITSWGRAIPSSGPTWLASPYDFKK